MNKCLLKIEKFFVFVLVLVFGLSITAYAEDDSENIDVEQSSFVSNVGQWNSIEDFEQCVDGIYNVNDNARASMSGVIRLYQSGTKLCCNYSTSYTYDVNKIGVKNIKLQYKGSLGIWHTIITLNDEYRRNASDFMGSFSCNGVVGRTYRAKGTHYISDDSYSESRNNETEGLTFR
ncbi:MAG: hypothetical protein SOW08_00180 [Lachnospiraceae bacterium]|nr:hypothetical protein [Lachnospiraceae bacterium]